MLVASFMKGLYTLFFQYYLLIYITWFTLLSVWQFTKFNEWQLGPFLHYPVLFVYTNKASPASLCLYFFTNDCQFR